MPFLYILPKRTVRKPLLSSVSSSFTYKTITQLQKALQSLPENPSLSWKEPTFQKQLIHYEKNILSLNEWTQAIMQCSQILKDNYLKSEWFENKKPHTSIFNFKSYNKEPFQTLVQKLSVPATYITFWGDLHGSIHSFLRTLQILIKKGFLQDNFTIIDPHFYMIFLGDYTDRGKYGVEIWYTLARLKIANPHNVIILRGNHEDADLNDAYGFVLECDNKFKDPDEKRKGLITLFNLYNLLPAALFLGIENSTEYVQCCHGGLEPGFNPQNLLNSTASFQLIESLDQKVSLNTLSFKPFIEEIKNNPCYSKFFKSSHLIKMPSDLGFLWNDFFINPLTIAQCNKGRGIAFGKEATQSFLKIFSSPQAQLKAIIRAHQHNNSSGGNMLNLLREKHGMTTLWDDIPTVITLCSAPDAEGLKFNDDSFLLIKTHKNYDCWKMEHIHHSILRA
jgi:hypothetical protein